MKVAVVSNGNAFSTLMLRKVFEEHEVVGAVLVRVPPGEGGRLATLRRLARRTGLRYAWHKLGTLAWPRIYGSAVRRPVFLDDLCRRRGVPSIDARSVNDEASRAFLVGLRPQVLLSVSCPERIAPDVLAIPTVAAVNIHWAPLPTYGGIAPYFWVLRNAEPRTGLTVHVMAPELDAGPVLLRREVNILPDDTSLSLQLRLVREGGEALVDALSALPGSLEGAERQDPTVRSYFSWPTPQDVRALRQRGRRLARWRDYRRFFAMIRSR